MRETSEPHGVTEGGGSPDEWLLLSRVGESTRSIADFHPVHAKGMVDEGWVHWVTRSAAVEFAREMHRAPEDNRLALLANHSDLLDGIASGLREIEDRAARLDDESWRERIRTRAGELAVRMDVCTPFDLGQLALFTNAVAGLLRQDSMADL